jgi:hypothetical protein
MRLEINMSANATSPLSPAEMLAALSAPFPASEVEFRPGAVNGNRALALPYVDARAVMDRLDAVLGLGGWQDAYEPLPDGTAVCTLCVRVGGEWVTHQDVGGPSDQADPGDRRKASFSDALKRAAVKVGVARYLYGLPPIWVDWDAQKKRFARDPQLPAAAPPLANGKAATAAAAPAGGKSKGPALPKDGAELEKRLTDYEAKLVKEGVCAAGDLLTAVRTAGVKAGYVPELVRWSKPAIELAVEETKQFEALCRAGKGPVHAPVASS